MTTTAPAGTSPVRLSALAFLLLSVIAIALTGLVFLGGATQWGWACFGFLIVAVMSVPFLNPRQRIFSMWGVTFFVALIGAGIRGIVIAINYPDPKTVEVTFTRGRSFDELVGTAAVCVVVIAATVIGYCIVAWREPRTVEISEDRGLRAGDLSEGLIVVLGSIYVVLGLIGTFLYARSVGGLGASIAERRAVIDPGGEFNSYGNYEYLASMGSVGAVFILAAMLNRHRRLGPVRWVLVGVAFVAGFSLNYVTTSRTDLVFVTIAAIVVILLIRGSVNPLAVTAVVLVALTAIGALSATRSGDTDADIGVAYGFESTLLNRNAMDLSKTLIIADATPEILPYQYGKTIAAYAIAPIPRSLWPSKPVISPGPIIGKALYGQFRSGIPPGMTAELIWNFGPLLAVPGGFILGLVLGGVERRWYPRDPKNVTAVMGYALVVLPLGKGAFGVAIGQTVAASGQLAVLIVPFLVLGAILRARNKRSANDSAAVPAAHRVHPARTGSG